MGCILYAPCGEFQARRLYCRYNAFGADNCRHGIAGAVFLPIPLPYGSCVLDFARAAVFLST